MVDKGNRHWEHEAGGFSDKEAQRRPPACRGSTRSVVEYGARATNPDGQGSTLSLRSVEFTSINARR